MKFSVASGGVQPAEARDDLSLLSVFGQPMSAKDEHVQFVVKFVQNQNEVPRLAEILSHLIGVFLGFGLHCGLLLNDGLGQLVQRAACKVVLHPLFKKCGSQISVGKLGRESPAWMKDVPRGLVLRCAAVPRILISETVDRSIPNGLIGLDEHVLAERNPNVIDNQMPNAEVSEIQISGFLNRGRVLLQSISEGSAYGGILRKPAFASTFGYGLANINRFAELAASVSRRHRRICWERAIIVDSVDASAHHVIH